MFENLNFGKTGFKTGVLEKHFISYSCILFLIFNALRSFFKNHVIFSKILFFLEFRLIQSVFWSIETNFQSIKNREQAFLKVRSWIIQLTFSKVLKLFSLSLRFELGSTSNFCHFLPKFLQGFPLSKSVCPYYPLLFIYIQFYMHFFMHWRFISDYA